MRPTLDILFRVIGTEVPADHGYALFSVLFPRSGDGERPLDRWMHGNSHIGLQTIRRRFVRRGFDWHGWIVALVVVLASVTAAEAICYEEHAADQDCAVCQTRHQPAAKPSASVQVGYADIAEPIEPADDVGWIGSGHFHRISARGPPA